ncbi:MAG: hypothetical protein WAV07_19250 [Candidatus Contendobacter sp.]
MILDRPTLARLREQAAQARKVGRYAQAAHWERQAVELAGTLGLIGERTRALLWEGYSLRHAGQDDLALAVLLQAIHEPAIDPADRFSALIAILHISLERKSARFCRALLEQGRRDLVEFRQPWSMLLDFLEGELAFRRGDFAAAWDWYGRAWAGRREIHPRLTPTTHLWALCRTAFRRRDRVELERLTHQLNELRQNSILEQQLVMRAQWLCWRAQRAAMASAVNADSTPVEQARVFLAAAEERELRDFGARLEALRVLALAGDWDLIDVALRRKPLPPDTFETAIGLGDLMLGRARAAWALPAVDDDYGETAIGTVSSLAAGLGEAAIHYQSALKLAEDQDRRLETSWHSDTVHQRLVLIKSGRQVR